MYFKIDTDGIDISFSSFYLWQHVDVINIAVDTRLPYVSRGFIFIA